MMNIIDRIISFFSPETGYKREVFRESLRTYNSAKIKKTDDSWLPRTLDADSATLPYIARLRSRSRDLIRNNVWASSALETIVQNAVGTGISPQVKADKEISKEIEEMLEFAFRGIDSTGEMDFYELQGLALRELLEAGECFVKINFSSQKKNILLQFIDADRIWSNRTESVVGNEIRNGIEIDANGKHVAYYVNDHPGAYTKKTEEKRVQAKDMIHLFFRKRIDQTRGVPIFSSVINQLHDLNEYVEAELVSARIAACLSVMIRRQHQGLPSQNDDGDNIQSLHPGMIARLAPGEDIAVIDPKRPGDQFPAFTAFQIRSVASGVNLSYEAIAKDYSKVNYSSGRLALLQDRASYRIIQNFLINHFCDRVVNEIQELRFLRGEQREIYPVSWLCPGFEWVDPEKEMASQIEAIKNNLKSKSQVVAEMGRDYEEVLMQRKKEMDLEKEIGVHDESIQDTLDVSQSQDAE